ncbi:MAG: hypothetical protein EOP56_01885 [Sphingobacteriales bacterium]|nr:MAG: hypothetical protein EOP56_01885 [Sphingobacteriales bacterium]
MKLIKTIFVLLALYVAMEATAQAKTDGQQPNINNLDAQGKKHGMWIVKEGARMGEAGYSELGSYNHGRKFGQWYKMNSDGEVVAIEHFRNNTLHGEVKYFEGGKLTSIGHYWGLNQDRTIDTIMVEHPITGDQSLVAVSSDRGSVRHGSWRFYDPESGRLVKEEQYQVDDLITSRDFTMTHRDSLYYYHRAARLPHNQKKPPVKAPRGKNVSYLNY